MNSRLVLALGAVLAPLMAGAQEVRVRTEPRGIALALVGEENRAVIGVTTSTGSARDTLGLLVSSVTPGGPAEKAGIEEGNRIAGVNGVNLKLAPVDVGDWDMANVMSRRLTRELGKLKPGDEAELKVYASGQTRTVRVKTVAADSLYRPRRVGVVENDRAVLGITLGNTGSKRDTNGVLIMGVDDDGPAAKAGIEEGNRIAAINGVDLRVARDDAGDEFIAGAKVRRLQRELEKVKAGDEVTLRIYSGGRTRDLRVKTVAISSLPRRRTMIFSGTPLAEPGVPVPPVPLLEHDIQLRLRSELDRVRGDLQRLRPQLERVILRRVTM